MHLKARPFDGRQTPERRGRRTVETVIRIALEGPMNRLLASLALLSAPCLASAAPGTGLERNETHSQIESRFLEKQKVCDSFQGGDPQRRERCLQEAQAARSAERAAAEAGHAEVAARREARVAAGADPRASLQRAAEEELAVQRSIEMARCDAAPREERDSCRAVARARYGK
jgi:hypothetical protein